MNGKALPPPDIHTLWRIKDEGRDCSAGEFGGRQLRRSSVGTLEGTFHVIPQLLPQRCSCRQRSTLLPPLLPVPPLQVLQLLGGDGETASLR